MTPTPPERPRTLVRGLVIALIGAGILSASGAFGTGAAPLAQRLVYWAAVMALGGLWGHLCGTVVARRVDMDEHPWRAVAVLTLVIAGPLVLAVWAATGLVFAYRLHPLSALPGLIVPVLIVTAAVSAANIFLGRAQPRLTHADQTSSPSRVAFLDRLPPKLRGAAIRAVQAEDHYLRLHTDRGSDLILMRLSDAVEELDGLEGARTHRSWWVARDAVRGIERRDGRATLTLEDDLRAPVSRRYARALRAAGWW